MSLFKLAQLDVVSSLVSQQVLLSFSKSIWKTRPSYLIWVLVLSFQTMIQTVSEWSDGSCTECRMNLNVTGTGNDPLKKYGLDTAGIRSLFGLFIRPQPIEKFPRWCLSICMRNMKTSPASKSIRTNSRLIIWNFLGFHPACVFLWMLVLFIPSV